MKTKASVTGCKEKKETAIKEFKVIRMGAGKKSCRRAASVSLW